MFWGCPSYLKHCSPQALILSPSGMTLDKPDWCMEAHNHGNSVVLFFSPGVSPSVSQMQQETAESNIEASDNIVQCTVVTVSIPFNSISLSNSTTTAV